MTGILQDLRYALRGLFKSPALWLWRSLALALGIGANVAVFAVMNAILLNPSGTPHPGSVVALRVKYAIGDLQNISIPAPDFGGRSRRASTSSPPLRSCETPTTTTPPTDRIQNA